MIEGQFFTASLKMFALNITEEQARGSRHRNSARFVKKLLAWVRYEEITLYEVTQTL